MTSDLALALEEMATASGLSKSHLMRLGLWKLIASYRRHGKEALRGPKYSRPYRPRARPADTQEPRNKGTQEPASEEPRRVWSWERERVYQPRKRRNRKTNTDDAAVTAATK